MRYFVKITLIILALSAIGYIMIGKISPLIVSAIMLAFLSFSYPDIKKGFKKSDEIFQGMIATAIIFFISLALLAD